MTTNVKSKMMTAFINDVIQAMFLQLMIKLKEIDILFYGGALFLD